MCIHDITENVFLLTLRGSDNGAFGGFTVTLRSDSGEVRENFLLSNGRGDYPWAAEGLEEGLWTVTVTATVNGQAVSKTITVKDRPKLELNKTTKITFGGSLGVECTFTPAESGSYRFYMTGGGGTTILNAYERYMLEI